MWMAPKGDLIITICLPYPTPLLNIEITLDGLAQDETTNF